MPQRFENNYDGNEGCCEHEKVLKRGNSNAPRCELFGASKEVINTTYLTLGKKQGIFFLSL